MDLKLADKVAVVAGGSKGIGAATARLLAEEGAKLLLAARGEEALAANAGRATRRHRRRGAYHLRRSVVARTGRGRGQGGHSTPTGVSTSSSIRRGRHAAAPLTNCPMSCGADAFNLKFFGAMRMVRAVLPAMRANKYGRIVNVAGNTGRQPHPALLPGGCANAALLSFTKGLSEDIIKDGIVMNALQPGPARTEHWDVLMTNLSRGTGLSNAEFEAEFLKAIPMGRTAEAREMAQMIVFLASGRRRLHDRPLGHRRRRLDQGTCLIGIRIGYQVSGIGYQVSGIRDQESGNIF